MDDVYPYIAPYLSNPFQIRDLLEEHKDLSQADLLALVIKKIEKADGVERTDLKILANKLEERTG